MSKLPDYGKKIDFHALVQQDEEFKKLLVANRGQMDFQNPRHVMQLTKSLLRRDFGRKLELPDDRLCPPVPVRYSYIRWIQALIDTTSGSYYEPFNPSREVLGIDIGVGSSCIYPLIGTALRPNWRFFGTEIDEKNFNYAQRNVQINNLDSRIRVFRTSALDLHIPLGRLRIQHADFTMCNPPFYTSRGDMNSTWTKSEAPSAVCTGAEVEMITEGGDAGFVLKMVEESKEHREKVQWYTSMLGKLSSVATIIGSLREAECKNWAVGSLVTGGKTRRWVVGWSWGDLRPCNEIARGEVPNRAILPPPTECTIPLQNKDRQFVATEICKVMGGLSLNWTWRQDRWAGLAFANENVWSRAARRKMQRSRQHDPANNDRMEIDACKEDEDGMGDIEPEIVAALGVKIAMTTDSVEIRWLMGHDHVLFESFCGMLRRHLTS